MAVPRNRHSNARKNKRRANQALVATQGNTCPNCGAMKRSHRACLECGFYKSSQVVSAQNDSE